MSIVNVSRETEAKLRHYLALLLKWQKAVNLVSPATLNQAWERHFVDSIQLISYIPNHVKTVVDFGSGAGFPGMIIAICRPDLEVILIESDSKKCSFLKTVSRETETPVSIINERIEAIPAVKVDLVTARALTSLQDLLSFSLPYAQLHTGVVLLFPKGKRADEEIREAQAIYRFDIETFQSVTDQDAKTLRISNLVKKDV